MLNKILGKNIPINNIILWVTIAILTLIIIFIVYRLAIRPFKKRAQESKNKLPDLSDLNKQHFWNVKENKEIKHYKRKKGNINDLIKAEDLKDDISLDFISQFGTKKKIIIKKLPEGLIQMEKTTEDHQGETQVQSFVFNSNEDKDFEDILGDLTNSMKVTTAFKKSQQEDTIAKEIDSLSKSQQAMNEAFEKLDKLFDEKIKTTEGGSQHD